MMPARALNPVDREDDLAGIRSAGTSSAIACTRTRIPNESDPKQTKLEAQASQAKAGRAADHEEWIVNARGANLFP